MPHHSDAHDMSAPDLLRAAARLVSKALNSFNMGETRCESCAHRLFQNKGHARAYEKLSTLPGRLKQAADELQAAATDTSRTVRAFPHDDSHDEDV